MRGRLEAFIRYHFSWRLHGKHLIWTRYFRLYCDGGYPNFYWIPRYDKYGYDKYWGMRGFCLTWMGRQFFFSFGLDKRGFYKK